MVLDGKGSGQERASKVETRRDLGDTLHLIPPERGAERLDSTTRNFLRLNEGWATRQPIPHGACPDCQPRIPRNHVRLSSEFCRSNKNLPWKHNSQLKEAILYWKCCSGRGMRPWNEGANLMAGVDQPNL